ncbi:MAG: hypothetical protein ACKOC5_06525, partial [Chloroflexota bacterium]
PQPFAGRGDMSDLVLALPAQVAPGQAQDVLRLAEYLGYASLHDAFRPRVSLGGDPTAEPWTGYQMIAYGLPSENPYIAAANPSLAQPFVPGSNQIVQTVDKVVYRLPDDVSLGFVQLLNAPWSDQNALLAVTGSTDEGVSWAMNSLLVTGLRDRLNGNLAALLSADDLRSTDTRSLQAGQSLSPQLVQLMQPQGQVTPTPETAVAAAGPAATPTPAVEPAQSPAQPPAAPANPLIPGVQGLAGSLGSRPPWLLPLMLASALLVLAIGGASLLRRR